MTVLLISADPTLIAAVERCAAAAGMTPERADATTASHRWERPALVLVGADQLALLPALPRRADVVVVSAGAGVGLASEPDADTWRLALALGAEHVVTLPQADGWLVDRLGRAEDRRGAAGVILGVIPASGGAGASTLALAVAAVAASRARSTLVIDADGWGGGLEILAGCDGQPGARWSDVHAGEGRIAPASLREAFPMANGSAILSVQRRRDGAPSRDQLHAVADAARRAFDLVVIDLPRALAADVDTDQRIVLARDRVRSVLAAAHLRSLHADALVAMRHGRGGIDAADAAHAIGAPITASFASERVIAEAGEHGDPLPRRGALVAAATALLDRVLS